MARDDARINILDALTGVYVATGMGGTAAIDESFRSHYEPRRVPPLSVPSFMPNRPAAHPVIREKPHKLPLNVENATERRKRHPPPPGAPNVGTASGEPQ